MKEYTLLGHPTTKSLSPYIHNTAFDYFKLNSVYTLSDILREELPSKVQEIRSGKLYGANVTIPYKCDVISYVDELSVVAKRCHSVNTLYMKNNKIMGASTDGKGVVLSLQEQGINIRGSKIVLLGTGGAARAITATLQDYDIDEILIVGRCPKKVQKMMDSFSCSGMLFEDANLKFYLENTNLIINSTSVGMYPNHQASPIPEDYIHRRHIVLDIVYKPVQTKLLQIAAKKNARIVNGVGMLIHQARLSFELWTGYLPPANILYQRIVTDGLLAK